MDKSLVDSLVPDAHAIVYDLRPRQMAQYDEVIDSYIQVMQRCPGVLCIAQFGSVSVPGISDVDLLVICDDKEYLKVIDQSKCAITTSDPDLYIFWHPSTILPISLLPASRMLHTFEGVHALWGDTRILEDNSTVSDYVSFINTLVWNSYFWRLIASLNLRRVRLRLLLLLTGNAAQSVAANHLAVGTGDPKAELRARIRAAREAILASSEKEQVNRLAADTFRQMLTDWEQADWLVQAWWSEHGWPLSPPLPASLRLSRRAKVVFSQAPMDDKGKSLRPDKRIWPFGWVPSKKIVVLPSVYSDISRLIAPAFGQRVAKVLHSQPLPECSLQNRAEVWGSALQAYGEAVRRVREFSVSVFNSDATLFSDPFVTPFGV